MPRPTWWPPPGPGGNRDDDRDRELRQGEVDGDHLAQADGEEALELETHVLLERGVLVCEHGGEVAGAAAATEDRPAVAQRLGIAQAGVLLAVGVVARAGDGREAALRRLGQRPQQRDLAPRVAAHAARVVEQPRRVGGALTDAA
jgi:hypothetical protein